MCQQLQETDENIRKGSCHPAYSNHVGVLSLEVVNVNIHSGHYHELSSV
jgi:hypothetical protein